MCDLMPTVVFMMMKHAVMHSACVCILSIQICINIANMVLTCSRINEGVEDGGNWVN